MSKMKYLINSVLIAGIIILGSAACQEDGSEDPLSVSAGSQFNIAYNQEVIIENENLLLKFTEIKEDSRCPVNANCVWEGRLAIVIQANSNSIDLSIGGLSEPVKELEGYKITLVDVVAPTRWAGVVAKNDDYIVAILVEKI